MSQIILVKNGRTYPQLTSYEHKKHITFIQQYKFNIELLENYFSDVLEILFGVRDFDMAIINGQIVRCTKYSLFETFIVDNYDIDSISSYGVALDIGANDGLTALKLAEKFGLVIAFEPIPENVVDIQYNTSGIRNSIDIIPIGCSDSFMRGTISNEVACNERFTFSSHPCVFGKADDFVNKELNVSVIKIDIEGEESRAIKGAEEIIKRCHPIMLVATYHYKTQDEEVKELLKKMGYTKFSYIENWERVLKAERVLKTEY